MCVIKKSEVVVKEKPVETAKLNCENCRKPADFVVCRKCMRDYLDATQRLEEIRRL